MLFKSKQFNSILIWDFLYYLQLWLCNTNQFWGNSREVVFIYHDTTASGLLISSQTQIYTVLLLCLIIQWMIRRWHRKYSLWFWDRNIWKPWNQRFPSSSHMLTIYTEAQVVLEILTIHSLLITYQIIN